MKSFGKHSPKFLASLAIFIFAINTSFALGFELQEQKDKGFTMTQADANHKSVFVEENFGLDLVRILSEFKTNAVAGGAITQDSSVLHLLQKPCFEQEKVYRYRDKRDFISQQIFPYHFFW